MASREKNCSATPCTPRTFGSTSMTRSSVISRTNSTSPSGPRQRTDTLSRWIWPRRRGDDRGRLDLATLIGDQLEGCGPAPAGGGDARHDGAAIADRDVVGHGD